MTNHGSRFSCPFYFTGSLGGHNILQRRCMGGSEYSSTNYKTHETKTSHFASLLFCKAMHADYFHDMTYWQGKTFSTIDPLGGGSIGHRWIPLRVQYWGRYSHAMQRFDDFFTVSINKERDKQSRCRWFAAPWRSSDVTIMAGYFFVRFHLRDMNRIALL